MADVVVQEELDLQGVATGVEREDTGADDSEKIAEPFDPEDIDVVTKSMTVDLLLSRTRSEMIDLQPDFQRRWGVWDAKRQSRLIESEPSLASAWPRQSKSEQRCFELLRRAYIDARYSPHFKISGEELNWLAARIEILQEAVKAACEVRLAELGGAS